jgi:uncharacterized repeat protein (TIGR01451 family)
MPYYDRLYFPGIRTCYAYDPTDYVKYYFVAMQECTTTVKVYQEAASGTQEKYSADYGAAAATLSTTSQGGSITLAKSVSPPSGGANTLFTWTITYTNNTDYPVGDPQSGNGLVLIDEAVPTNTSYVSGSATCSGSCLRYYSTDNGATWTTTEPVPASSVNKIKWYINQTIPAHSSGTVSFQSRVNSGVPGNPLICNTASGRIDDGTLLVTDTVCANAGVDLHLSKVVNYATPCENSNVTYTITVTNPSTGGATNVQVKDQLPSGLTYQSSTPSQGSYSNVTHIWTVGNLAAGTSATLSITATVNSGTGGQIITNTGSITHADQTDPVSSNNSAHADIAVLSRPVAVADSNTPVCVGDTIQLYGGPSGMASYAWTGPLGFTSNLQNPTRGSATLGMAGTYTLTVTAENGCSDTTSTYVTVQTCATPPNTPSNTSPGNGTCVGLPVTLTASAFSDPGTGEYQVAAHWQIRASTGGYSYPVFDSGTDTGNLTSIVIPDGILSDSSSYCWHVRYQGNLGAWSEYSAETCFNTNPVATASSNSPVCEGGTIQLTGGPSDMSTYSWVGPDGFTGDTRNVSRTGATLSMAGAYTLTVTDANGCTSNAITNIVVNASPIATASSDSPVCAGHTIQLYGGPDAMTSYSWAGPLGFTSILQNPTRGSATTGMSGTYTLTVTAADGCNNTVSTYVSVVTCATPPNIPSNLSPSPASCVGLPVTLTASPFSDPGSGEYQIASHWQVRASTGSYSDPVFDSIKNTGNLTRIDIPLGILSDSSSYCWHVQYQGNLGAWSEYSNETCFYTNPVATASSNSPVCHKTAIQLFGGPDGMVSYYWVGPTGSGFNSYEQNPVIWPDESGNLTPELAGNYTLTVTDANGCSGNVTITVDMNMECECPPAQPINLSPGNESCVQLPVQLVSSEFAAAEEPEGTPDDWLAGTEWQIRELGQDYATPVYDLVAGNVTSITVPLGILSPGTTYYWHVKHQDNEGAWSIYSEETRFYTNPEATAVSNSSVCEGGTIQLTGGPSGMSSYSWTGPNGFTSNAQNVSRSDATLSMAGDYTLTVTDSNGCTSNANTNVVVNARPVATASSNSPVCEGATIYLYGGPDGMAYYSWSGPGFSSSAQNPTIPNATAGMAGVYTLSVSNASGCTDIAYAYVQVDILVATASSNSPVSVGATVYLYGGPDGMSSYSWSGPGFTSSAQNPTIPNATLGMTGEYTLTVTSANGCTDNATTDVVVNAGVALDPASKADSLLIDADGNGQASPGDTLLYTVTVWNEGTADATGVVFTDTPDPNTTLVVGSVATTKGSVTRGNTPGDTWAEVNIGILLAGGPASETVTISFQVTINDPLPPGVTNVYNQGVFTSNEVPPAPTDDPDTAPDDDFTATPLGGPGPGPGPAGPPSGSGVPVFPNMYVGIAAAFGAGILAYLIRKRLLRRL